MKKPSNAEHNIQNLAYDPVHAVKKKNAKRAQPDRTANK